MADFDLNFDDDTDNDEIESPVDGPTPDWMKSASASSTGSSFSEDEAPDWLKSIRAGKGITTEDEGDDAGASASAGSDDGMSDLERLLAEEGIDLGTVSEERPEGSEGMSAKDWLISTSEDDLIRKRLDDEPMEETVLSPMPTASAPPAEEPVAPTVASSDMSDDGMSDLERLLAEEGIDLGTVSEERPEGSEGMSAKDWLISTSEDDLVRKRLDDTPMEETVLSSTPVADTPTPEPVVEPEPSLDLSDDDDDLPDWLNEFPDDEPAVEEAVSPEPVAEMGPGADDDDDDKMVVQDDLPDWLQEFGDDEGETASSEPAQPIADTPVSLDTDDDDLPDWLQDFEGDEPQPVDNTPTPEPVAEAEASFDLSDDDDDDLPDWLNEFPDDAPAAEEAVSPEPVMAEMGPGADDDDDDKMVVQDDLPDWLRDDDADATPPAAPEPVSEPELQAEPTAEAFTSDDEDLPDWLQEVEDGSDAPTLSATPVEVEDEDLPDWLNDIQEDDGPKAESDPLSGTAAEPDLGDDDLPDWLREVKEEDAAPTPVEALPIETDDDDLPDWLQEDEPGTASVPSEMAPVASGSDDVVEDDLPDWLKDVENEDEPEPVPMSSPEPTAVVSAVADDSEDLPDWLREVDTEEDDDLFEPSDPSIDPFLDVEDESSTLIEEDLPDWLQEVEEVETSPEPVSDSAPAPVEAVVSQDEAIEGEELPDWLKEVADEEGEDLVTSPAPEPVIASVETSEGEDDVEAEELPDWLKEVGEEEEDADVPEPVLASPSVDIEETIDDTPTWLKEIDTEPEEAEPVILESSLDADVLEPLATTDDTAASTTAETLPSDDMPDWLQKMREDGFEQEAPPPAIHPAMPTAPASAQQPAVAHVVSVTPRPAPVIIEPDRVPTDLPQDPDERLTMAQAARDAGNADEAIRIFDSLVATGSHLDTVIESAQQLVDAQPGNYKALQLMGDAMMRDGRLQNALNAYRQAMTNLS